MRGVTVSYLPPVVAPAIADRARAGYAPPAASCSKRATASRNRSGTRIVRFVAGTTHTVVRTPVATA